MSVYCPCSSNSTRLCDAVSPNDCYRYPFDTPLSYLQFTLQLLTEDTIGKINSELAQHNFVIGLFYEKDELHIRCDHGDFMRACSYFMDAAKLYGVDQYLLPTYEKIKNLSSFEDYKVSLFPSQSSSTNTNRGDGASKSMRMDTIILQSNSQWIQIRIVLTHFQHTCNHGILRNTLIA